VEEKKTTVIPRVTASEKGKAQTINPKDKPLDQQWASGVLQANRNCSVNTHRPTALLWGQERVRKDGTERVKISLNCRHKIWGIRKKRLRKGGCGGVGLLESAA
jgi:hypothetical protein